MVLTDRIFQSNDQQLTTLKWNLKTAGGLLLLLWFDQLQQHFNMESKRIRSSWACSELFFDSLITPLASRMGTLLWHVLPHFFGSFLTTQPTFRNFQFWTKLSSHKKSKHIKEVEGVVSRLSKNLTRHNIQQKTRQMSKHWLRQYTTYDIFENYCISQSSYFP